MKPFFNPAFKAQLKQATVDFELHTSAELVVLISPKSGDYAVVAWMFAALTGLIGFTLMMRKCNY